jgi:hypothetical protein
VTIFEVPHNLSHSQTNNLVGDYCAAQYWYERVLGKPSRPGWAAIGGSALHASSEEWDWKLLEEGNTDDSPERLRELFGRALDAQIAEVEERTPYPREEWNLSGRTIKSKTSMDGGPNRKDEAWWREMGPEMLRLWTAWRLNSPWEIAVFPDPETGHDVVGIETEYWVEIGPAPSHGFIDRVFEQTIDGVVEYLVVDLKSGREPDDTAQLGSYRLGLQRRYGIDPRWGAYWLGGSGSTTPLTPLRDLWPDERVEQRYEKARRIQLAGDFTHKPSNLCGSCGVREYCPVAGGAKAAETIQPWSSEVEIRVAPPKSAH